MEKSYVQFNAFASYKALKYFAGSPCENLSIAVQRRTFIVLLLILATRDTSSTWAMVTSEAKGYRGSNYVDIQGKDHLQDAFEQIQIENHDRKSIESP